MTVWRLDTGGVKAIRKHANKMVANGTTLKDTKGKRRNAKTEALQEASRGASAEMQAGEENIISAVSTTRQRPICIVILCR